MGRGPVEMTYFSSYAWNDSTGLITFLDSEGGKAVKLNMASLEKTRFSVNNGKRYSRLVALDNDNYLCLATDYVNKRTADKPIPYIYLLNQDFQIVDSLCDMVNREKKTIEGVGNVQKRGSGLDSKPITSTSSGSRPSGCYVSRDCLSASARRRGPR